MQADIYCNIFAIFVI